MAEQSVVQDLVPNPVDEPAAADSERKLNLFDLHAICQDKDKLIEKLVEWGFIPKPGDYLCPNCSHPLTLSSAEDRCDKLRWLCTNYVSVRKQKRRFCGQRIELRTGTFFACSKLTIFQVLGFVNLWVYGASLNLIKVQLGISSNKTVVDWASFCREVVLDAYIENVEPIGGEGIIVEIDESKFGKRKYHRGHAVDGQWVFGGYERGTGKVFMVAVERRDKDTLLPIIRDWIRPGSTIISDFWKAYDCLSDEGYIHLKVNHSLHFVDPTTAAHTNHIESSWLAAKSTFKAAGRKRAHIPGSNFGNLARYMFYKSCKEMKADRCLAFFQLAGRLYNPLHPRTVSQLADIDDEELDVQFDDELLA